MIKGFVLELEGSMCGFGGSGGTLGTGASEKSWDVRLEPFGVTWLDVVLGSGGGDSFGVARSDG